MKGNVSLIFQPWRPKPAKSGLLCHYRRNPLILENLGWQHLWFFWEEQMLVDRTRKIFTVVYSHNDQTCHTLALCRKEAWHRRLPCVFEVQRKVKLIDDGGNQKHGCLCRRMSDWDETWKRHLKSLITDGHGEYLRKFIKLSWYHLCHFLYACYLYTYFT